MKSLVISNGQINDLDLLKSVSRKVDFIVCADGGTNYISKVNIVPNLVVGDLDSINDEVLDIINSKNIPLKKYNPHKDYTDTELAMDYLIEKGFDEIIFMGVTGTRIDHTLANILLLDKLLKKGVKGIIIDDKNVIYIVDDELVLDREEETFVSVIPITTSGARVTLKGFEYELDKFDINFSSTIGISNRILSDKGYIKIEAGTCLVIKSKD